MFYHVKQVDETGHDKDLEKRLYWHEQVDKVLKFFLEKWTPIYKEKGIDLTICITGDHSTPVLYGDHTHEPVPFGISTIGLMSNENDPQSSFKNDIKDQVTCYDEVECAKGSLGRFTGCEAIEFMKNFNVLCRTKLGCQ